jgi:MFS family permease
LGQLLEIPIMPFLGVWITRLGMKRIIVLGVLAQALRSFVLALWLLVVAQGLNSLFIVYFIVAAMVVVERLSPNHMRAQAQGLFVLALRGLGPLCGHVLAGRVYDYFALANGSHAWSLIFLIPAVASSLIALLFFALFRDDGD